MGRPCGRVCARYTPSWTMITRCRIRFLELALNNEIGPRPKVPWRFCFNSWTAIQRMWLTSTMYSGSQTFMMQVCSTHGLPQNSLSLSTSSIQCIHLCFHSSPSQPENVAELEDQGTAGFFSLGSTKGLRESLTPVAIRVTR